MAKLYNRFHNGKGVKPIATTSKKATLVRALNSRLKGVCANNDEVCWVQQPFVRENAPTPKKKDIMNSFKPRKPSEWLQNKNAWLTNYDISNVVQQYEEANPKFKFMGVFPIDFALPANTSKCISPSICDLNIAQLQKRHNDVTQLGFVFNTDPHDKGGRHWIAMFVGLDANAANYGVYFYDSVAEPPPKEVRVYMDMLHKQLPVSSKRPSIAYNKDRRQYRGTECGVFSMLFLIRMQGGEPFTDVCATMGDDNALEKYRDLFFR
jgi:hypothetical protein